MSAVHLGTYEKAGGAGLYTLEPIDGEWTIGGFEAGVANASFGAVSARRGLHYFVDEQEPGWVGVHREAACGWERLARVWSGGDAPCYLALDREERCLAVANYGSGTVALFRLDHAGLPTEPPAVRGNSGSGPMAGRQDGPHAHCTVFAPDGRTLYHVDLGTDEILAYPVEPASGALGPRRVAYHAPPGSGPRHLAFHATAPRALLLSELASTLTVLDIEGDRLVARQCLTTLPPDFEGESLGGHLSVDAADARAYATNRGHDSIAVFAWDDEGDLRLLQHVPSGGKSPRSFVLLEGEEQLLVAHEESCNVTGFALRPDGRLSRLPVDIAVPGAAFLLAAPE